MADVKWIKVATSMFETNRKIKQIELMPEGDTILVIWLKLLLLAGNVNDGGAIYITPEIPYTEEMLANELRRPITTVRMALTVFENFGMISTKKGVIRLTSWEKYQSVDKLAELREKNRISQQKSRERRKALGCGDGMSRDSHVTVTGCHDIEEDGEENQDKDKEFHSFTHDAKNDNALERQHGELGKGVVFLSEEQKNDLLDKLSIDEFDKYVAIVANCELAGKRYKKKSHYQAILDMCARDRKVSEVS